MLLLLARRASTLARRRRHAICLPGTTDTYTRHKLRTVEIHDRNGTYPILVKETKMWTIDDTQSLVELVAKTKGEFNVVAWQKIADSFPGRTPEACKTKYELLLRDVVTATSGSRFKPSGKTRPRAKPGTYDLLSSGSTGWTAEDDKMLLALYEVWGTKWDKIAKSIGKHTDSQCQGRYYWLRKKSKLKPVPATDSNHTKNRRPATRQQANAKEPKDPANDDVSKRAQWTEAETRRLRDLLIEQGRFDYKEASKQLPGFSLAHIYYELDKVLSGPGRAAGLWTRPEHEALLELTKKHGRDWRSISLDMPTCRSANQCRLHYAYCCSGPMTKQKRWTADEEERLKLLVDLCQQGKLSARSVENLPPAAALSGIEELSSADLSRFSRALKKDCQAPEARDSAAPSWDRASSSGSVLWPLISLYMMTRTATQCRAKWAYTKRVARDSGLYRGPWTREEDAQLYELYQQAPNKWPWILQHLARQRGSAVAKARYTSYIRRYVAMLRECRGAEWDPMADKFEEVHMRCEVLAWSRRQLEGYRPHDPYECPFDMDLTGIGGETAQAASNPAKHTRAVV